MDRIPMINYSSFEEPPLDSIIVLDQKSKSRIKNIFNEMAMYNVMLYDSLREIRETDLVSFKRIILIEDYPKIEGNLEDIEVYVSMLKDKVDFFYIGSDELWVNIMSNLCETHLSDTTSLTYEMLSGIVFGNNIIQAKIKVDDSLDDIGVGLANSIIQKSNDANARDLALEYLQLHELFLQQRKDSEQMAVQLSNVKAELNLVKEERHRLYENYSDLMLNISEANTQLRDFEIMFSKGFYKKINLYRYRNAPNILYIKEYERLVYQNSFIKALYDTLRRNGHISVKVVNLFDNDGVSKIRQLPDYYKILGNKFYESEIYSNDFIAKCGNYERLLDKILGSSQGLDLLILVDSKNTFDTVIDGNVLVFNLCRNGERMKRYNLNPDNTVITSLKGDLHGYITWSHSPNYISAQRRGELPILTSSMNAVRKIYTAVMNYYNFG